MSDLHIPEPAYNFVRGSSDLLEHNRLNLHIAIVNTWEDIKHLSKIVISLKEYNTIKKKVIVSHELT